MLANWLIIIPARLGSTRLARKALRNVGGIPMVVRVYQRLEPLASLGAKIVVATDHDEIIRACRDFSVPCEMTAESHRSGTERCHELAQRHPHPYILNVQGDEPFVDLDDVKTLTAAVEADAACDLATLAYRSTDRADYASEHVVKAVLDRDGYALYFSRAMIPFIRDTGAEAFGFWQHQGIYAFRRAALNAFQALSPGRLERIESLEQLRALEQGMRIKVVQAKSRSFGIDTEADLEAANAKLKG